MKLGPGTYCNSAAAAPMPYNAAAGTPAAEFDAACRTESAVAGAECAGAVQ